MPEVSAVGPDLAQDVFQLHGAEASGRAVLRRGLRRVQVREVLAGLPRRTVAGEGCGGRTTGCAANAPPGRSLDA
jgi:hypothetical protein